MSIFYYDKTFDGLLSTVFDAYRLKIFPELLLTEGDVEPLFMTRQHTSVTDPAKADRVWTALGKRLSSRALNHIMYVWQSERQGVDMLIFNYIRRVIDSPTPIETDFTNSVISEMLKIAKRVGNDRMHLIQFVRFQQTKEGVFFALVSPDYNVLPMSISHFTDRFTDRPWAIYDIKRRYGFYYDLSVLKEVVIPDDGNVITSGGKINPDLLHENERIFQNLWVTYFQSISIKERANPKQQARCMPRRFWHLLPEMYDRIIT
ncbi:TIGR03915 family putative DNA repair protein [Leminorella grimontii]|uniref:TIGR03915 family putative DNA repair protein n=1 Tax=Leminorella grimontii TaxID=82981 RepID=UPI00208454CD|nr:TIGR03915 family putative DNA repair protein [Leminorella grimontii]GKX58054.1 DNA metabolism protein [Leminorella grimontii]